MFHEFHGIYSLYKSLFEIKATYNVHSTLAIWYFLVSLGVFKTNCTKIVFLVYIKQI